MNNDLKEDEKLSYVLQLKDSATGFRCALKIDPEKSSSFGELFDEYVRDIKDVAITPESLKNLNVIQDCIYNIDDDGELLEIYEGLILKQDDEVVSMEDEPEFRLIQSEDLPDWHRARF